MVQKKIDFFLLELEEIYYENQGFSTDKAYRDIERLATKCKKKLGTDGVINMSLRFADKMNHKISVSDSIELDQIIDSLILN